MFGEWQPLGFDPMRVAGMPWSPETGNPDDLKRVPAEDDED